jgi:hypothetical protein
MAAMSKRRKRNIRFSMWIAALREFVQYPTNNIRRQVLHLAETDDRVPEQYASQDRSNNLMDGLKAGDKQVWAKFLFSLRSDYRFQEFKEFSPFAGKLLFAVEYGCGFVTLKGDTDAFFHRIIAEEKGWKTFDADDYLIALPDLDTSKAEVIWVSGRPAAKGPRSANAPGLDVAELEDESA